MPEELTTKSATELARLIRSRSVSPVEVIEDFLPRIEHINPSLNAIITLADDVLDQARAAEATLMSGKDLGPLHGLPVTVKDTDHYKVMREFCEDPKGFVDAAIAE